MALHAIKSAAYALLPRRLLSRVLCARMPRRAILEVTTACNLDCPLCPTHMVPRRAKFLAPEQFEDVLTTCAGALRHVSFHIQGEPLLHPRLFDFVRRCSAAGVEAGFGTNGMLLERHLEEVFDSGLAYLAIAIDGADAADYALYRRRGDLETVLRNVRALVAEKRRRRAQRPAIHLQTILFPYNERREREIVELLEGLGGDSVVLKPPSYPADYDLAEHLGIELDPDARRRSEEAAARFLREIGVDDPEREPKRPRPDATGVLYRDRKLCPQLERAVVLSDGRVVPCCMDAVGLHAFGDLNERGFAEIWRGPAHAEVLARFFRRELDVCRTCDLS